MTSIDRWRWIHAFQFQIVNVLAEDVPKKICFSFHLKNVYVMHVRIFVGAWNVVGRSPVGSLAVDVSDWLNLKDAADMYVLGLVSRDFAFENHKRYRSGRPN
ncbi:TYPE IV INOSITOL POLYPHOSPHATE 5-PHOSPHATASE 7-LIKE [Salix purpurea]|uniref:TYPE IV INOSITOL POLYPHOSPHATE 5-PHOSPHATASE 7-LIKE n=1 Tax=Salix purpurea TaxID=77065 RepID=A0A9Q0V2Q9_SALPP|nr:TYPE IV INOSITOL POLYPHOSPHATE 5-PHOSPHATASE 7-LIKE [Salix purpurea]